MKAQVLRFDGETVAVIPAVEAGRITRLVETACVRAGLRLPPELVDVVGLMRRAPIIDSFPEGSELGTLVLGGDGESVSTSEAATRLEISDRRVRQLCLEGRFPSARKAGHTWLISENDVVNYRRTRRT